MRVNYRYAGVTGTHNKSSTLSLFAVNPKHKLLHSQTQGLVTKLGGCVCVCVCEEGGSELYVSSF